MAKKSNPINLFDQTNLKSNLRNRAVKGAATTGMAQIAKVVIRLGTTAVLARMISPEDYGLIAMTVVITGFISTFKDFGLSTATIQREHISHQQVSTLFWINVALGALLALVVIALAPLIAAFYSEPRLSLIAVVLSSALFIGGFILQPRALLRRNMQFKTIAKIEILAQIAGFIVAFWMAKKNYGYWALVAQSVSAIAFEMLFVWLSLRWLPSLPRKTEGIGSMLKFGTDVVTFNTINYFARQMDNILIGWYWGASSLAFYNKAYTLLLLPVKQINGPLISVSTPTLARAKNDSVQFKSFFLKSFDLVACISVPVVFLCFTFADQVVYILLGPNWTKCADLFRFLAPAAVAGVLLHPMGSLLLPLGMSSKYKKIGLYNSLCVVIVFFCGLPYGAEGVAIAYSIATVILLIPIWAIVVRGTPIALRNIVLTMLPALICTFVVTVTSLFIHHVLTQHLPEWLSTLLAGFWYCGVYALILLFGFKKLALFKAIYAELRKKNKPEAEVSE